MESWILNPLDHQGSPSDNSYGNPMLFLSLGLYVTSHGIGFTRLGTIVTKITGIPYWLLSP